jgi:hypothetical protein
MGTQFFRSREYRKSENTIISISSDKSTSVQSYSTIPGVGGHQKGREWGKAFPYVCKVFPFSLFPFQVGKSKSFLLQTICKKNACFRLVLYLL